MATVENHLIVLLISRSMCKF